MLIEGSVALVTGGVSGLGFGAASRSVGMGGKVVMMDINEDQGKTAQAHLGDAVRGLGVRINTPRVGGDE